MAKMTQERKEALTRQLAELRASGGMKRGPKVTIEHTIRTKSSGIVKITPYKIRDAVKYFCGECFCWEGNPKTDCPDPLCPLYPFRGRKATGEPDAAK